MKKLAIITTHPIQYNAPLFRLLHERRNIQVKVFYTWEQSQNGQLYDPGFGIHRQWDIPLLEGYEFTFVKNTASNPGSHHFNGIINPTLVREVLDFLPDAILVYGWSFRSHLKMIWYFHNRIPVLFRGDSTLLDEKYVYSFKIAIRRFFLKSVYRLIDKALYAGTANKQYFIKHGIKEYQLQWVPHAIDNHRFGDLSREDEVKVLEWRRALGYKDSDCVFLFAGKLEPKKNPLLLVDAFLSLNAENVGLIIAGNGELEQELKQKVRGLKNITILPFQNQQQMPILYRVADVFVLPSTGPGETWGLAVNEAMACGRAVVVSDQCGCAEDLVLQNGFIFEAGNKQQLTEVLQQFLNDPGLSYRMGSFGKNVINNWSFSVAAQKIEEVVCL